MALVCVYTLRFLYMWFIKRDADVQKMKTSSSSVCGMWGGGIGEGGLQTFVVLASALFIRTILQRIQTYRIKLPDHHFHMRVKRRS